MLNLSAKNIRLNARAADKENVIRLVAAGLAENGNVAEGYAQAMLDRETQTATFLGNGIAIPHGTLETRDLVKQTGVQIIQFPQGVEWGEGNTAYVVIGIAAKSDEHLTLLRQLTAVLSDEKAAQTLAQTQNIDEFIAVLSGKKNLPLLSEALISLNVESSSLITLAAINAAKLQEQGYVSQAFISETVSSQALPLGDDVFVTDSAKGNQASGLAVARNTQGQTLITAAASDNSLQPLLARLLDPSVRTQFKHVTATQIIALFKGEEQTSTLPVTQENHVVSASNEETAAQPQHEACFVVKNEHGLHARPSAMLVNEAKKFNAKIEVQNVEKNSPLVNAKSLMKIVSLGVTKGTTLRFVATGDDAEAALAALGAAIEAGLGE